MPLQNYDTNGWYNSNKAGKYSRIMMLIFLGLSKFKVKVQGSC